MEDFDYMDEDLFRKKHLYNYLDKILLNISTFLSKIELFKLKEDDVYNLIYKHPIFKNKNKINDFANKVNDSEIISQKVIDIQEESDMRKKKRSEVEDLKKILKNIDCKNLLDGENENKKKFLLPPGDEQKDKSEENNENENNEKDKDDDILVEDTKDVEKRDYLRKKKREEKKEKKEEKRKAKFNFKNCYICKEKLGLDNTHKFYGNICTK